jgi:hypothetical protein
MALSSKCHVVLVAALLVFSTAIFADDLPDDDAVNLLSQKAKKTADDFYEKTFEMRMRYEYAGCFLDPNDKAKLLELASQASAELKKIAQDQNNLKKQIEDYRGDDWEIRFGQTGLWRKVSADLLNTQTIKLEIDYRLARINGEIASPAQQQYLRQQARSNWAWCEAIKLSMEKVKCIGLSRSDELDDIAKALAGSECNENPEMLLSLAILQNKYAPDKFKNTLSSHSQVSEMLGKIILDCLALDPNLDSLNPVTAELAAGAALKINPAAYKDLLLAVAGDDRIETPGTLAVAAIAVAETEPQTAVKFFMESSALQFQKKETLLDLDAQATAEGAARLAYDNFSRNNIDCNLAVAAFENYVNIASNKLTEEMHYNYGEILLDCGRTKNAIETFTKLAENSQSVWRDKANFQLLKIQINAGQSDQSLPQLRNFILNCTGRNELKDRLRYEAMDLYCRMVLSRDGNDSARQVLDLLDTAEPTPDFPYDLYRAEATFRLGRLEDSARFMSKAVDANDDSLPPQTVLLLSEILDKIELWQQNAADYNQLLKNCETLAEYAFKSADTAQNNLLLAEVLILNGKGVKRPLPSNNEDTIWLRVMARTLMAQNKFEQAVKLWAQIAESKRNQSAEQSRKSYAWWQAKFYELDCLSKVPSANLKDIRHTIEVLQSTYAEIPAPWPEKLESLKQHCVTN